MGWGLPWKRGAESSSCGVTKESTHPGLIASLGGLPPPAPHPRGQTVPGTSPAEHHLPSPQPPLPTPGRLPDCDSEPGLRAGHACTCAHTCAVWCRPVCAHVCWGPDRPTPAAASRSALGPQPQAVWASGPRGVSESRSASRKARDRP